MWLARYAGDREVAGFTPGLGVTLLQPWERYLALIFPALWLLARSSKLKSDTYNKADKGNTGISESSSGQCMFPNV